jgi:hypothetical protein
VPVLGMLISVSWIEDIMETIVSYDKQSKRCESACIATCCWPNLIWHDKR